MTKSKLATLSTFSLTMITVGSVDSIRNLPATALFGSHLIFFFLLAALFFLIPSALVSAELASTIPKQGGIYIWLREAFGKRIGFLGIWFQWIENVIWYPTLLSFVAGTVGYLIDPSLSQNKVFLISVILCAFWGATFINLRGMKSSARFSTLCSLSGLLLPMVLIISLGAAWIYSGNPIHISFTKTALLPDFSQSHMWVALTGIILSFTGIEIATVHATHVEQPQRTFPKVLFFSVLIILSTLMLGSLAIAAVIPSNEISLVAGIMQAFDAFFSSYHMHWILPIIALMLILGGLGSISNWIIAPTEGLLIAGKDGHLPDVLQIVNKHQAPTVLLVIQAIIVSVLTMVFTLLPSINASYWLLTALATQLYMFMYMLMFAAGIKLRLSHHELPRSFQIPGGFTGMLIVGVIGLIGCTGTVIIGFIPPATMNIGSIARYELILLTGLIFMSLPPFLLSRHQAIPEYFKKASI